MKGESTNDQITFLSTKFNYPVWMVSRFVEFVPNPEALLEEFEKAPKRYIRINTLKSEIINVVRRLSDIGFQLKKTNLPELFEIITESLPLGATTEYLMGYYYIQDLSSCLAVNELEITRNQIILDMACAPGGKTTYISQKLKNTGLIIGLDTNKQRLRSTTCNLLRCGVSNVCLYHLDGTKVSDLGMKFDSILLDAPCSCEGIIAKDRSIIGKHSLENIRKCQKRQVNLLESALRVIKPGGLIIYSTCTLAPEENEMVIDGFLNDFDINLEPVKYGYDGLTYFGKKEFDNTLRYTKRLYPHMHDTSGFYIAKLRVNRS